MRTKIIQKELRLWSTDSCMGTFRYRSEVWEEPAARSILFYLFTLNEFVDQKCRIKVSLIPTLYGVNALAFSFQLPPLLE